jgi:hypothetical protein
MDDHEFEAALRRARQRAQGIFARAHGYQQKQTEARLRAAGVGERTLDAQAITGVLRVQGGPTMASKSATATVMDDAGSRAPAQQDSIIRDIRLLTDVAPVGGPITVRLNVDGVAVATVSIPADGTTGFIGKAALGDIAVPAGSWFNFDITAVGTTTPGGRVYVAPGLDVDVRRGGMKP